MRTAANLKRLQASLAPLLRQFGESITSARVGGSHCENYRKALTLSSDEKTVEAVTSTEVKTPEPTMSIAVTAEANEDEQIDNKAVGKDEQSLTSAFKSWLKRLLLPGTEEWKDQDLEVWQVDISLQFSGTPNKGHRKLDIDDRQVLSSLVQTTSRRKWKKRPELIEQYASLDQRVRHRIDEAIDAAKQSSSRERTWIAMSIINEPFKRMADKETRAFIQPEVSISLFFRLGQEVEPIYILDAQRGNTPLPYASCATLEVGNRTSCLYMLQTR
jgi:hypothetical protein